MNITRRAPSRGLPSLIPAAAGFLKNNIVLVVAALAAAVTSIIVPPDSQYLSYFDFKTLTCLFCTLAVVCALKNIKFFTTIAKSIVKASGNLRTAVTALVFITYFGSMLIANDMALITFLPLGYIVLSSTGNEKHMPFVFILQNIAANLGGMLTPFGNPQNLYLYTNFSIPTMEFVMIMLKPFIVATILILVCCFTVKKDKIELTEKVENRLPAARTAIYIVLFALSIAIVFNVIPYLLGLVIIFAALMFMDRKALTAVDYSLLLTFVFFFIFAGNMARIPEINALFSFLLSKNTLLVSVLSCQFISNVPSAVLLSQFTGNYADLLVGVNIGGTGTLIASLASLITFKEYLSHNPGCALSYILKFTAFNFGFLAVLVVVCLI